MIEVKVKHLHQPFPGLKHGSEVLLLPHANMCGTHRSHLKRMRGQPYATRSLSSVMTAATPPRQAGMLARKASCESASYGATMKSTPCTDVKDHGGHVFASQAVAKGGGACKHCELLIRAGSRSMSHESIVLQLEGGAKEVI